MEIRKSRAGMGLFHFDIAGSARKFASKGVMSGWLTKQGGMFSSWKRRLCVLVPSTLLFYFEDESADSPNGVVVLDSSTDITRLDSFDTKKFVIRIAPHMPNQTDSRVFHFHADNGAQAQEWIEAMTSKRFQDVEHRNHILEEILSTSTSQVEELKEKLKSHNIQCDESKSVLEATIAEIQGIAKDIGVSLRSLQLQVQAATNSDAGDDDGHRASGSDAGADRDSDAPSASPIRGGSPAPPSAGAGVGAGAGAGAAVADASPRRKGSEVADTVPSTLAAMKAAFGSLVAISRATQGDVDAHATTVHAAVTSLGQDRDTTAAKLATAAQAVRQLRKELNLMKLAAASQGTVGSARGSVSGTHKHRRWSSANIGHGFSAVQDLPDDMAGGVRAGAGRHSRSFDGDAGVAARGHVPHASDTRRSPVHVDTAAAQGEAGFVGRSTSMRSPAGMASGFKHLIGRRLSSPSVHAAVPDALRPATAAHDTHGAYGLIHVQVVDAKMLPDEFGVIGRHAILHLRCGNKLRTSEAVPVNEMVTEEDTFQADFNQSFAMKVFKPLFDPESFLYIDVFSRRRLTANKLVVQACVNMSRIEESPGVSHQITVQLQTPVKTGATPPTAPSFNPKSQPHLTLRLLFEPSAETPTHATVTGSPSVPTPNLVPPRPSPSPEAPRLPSRSPVPRRRRSRVGSVESHSSVSSAGSISADQLTDKQKLVLLTKGYKKLRRQKLAADAQVEKLTVLVRHLQGRGGNSGGGGGLPGGGRRSPAAGPPEARQARSASGASTTSAASAQLDPAVLRFG